MNKRLLRNTLISAAAACALGAACLFALRPAKPETANTPEGDEALLYIDEANMDSIDVKTPDSAYTVINVGEGYAVRGFEGIKYNRNLELFVKGVTRLTPQRLISGAAQNLTEYGLDNPSAEIRINLSNSSAKTILLGSETPAGDGFYALVENSVCTVSQSVGRCAEGINAFRDMVLGAIDIPTVTSLEIERGGERIVYIRGRNDDDALFDIKAEPWVMEYPYHEYVKGEDLSKALAPFTEIKAASFTNTPAADAAAYGVGETVIRITSDGRDYTISTGDAAGDGTVYAVYGGCDTVVTLSDEIYAFAAGFVPFDYIYKFVQLYSADRVARLEYDIDGKSCVCEKDGGGYSVNGKPVGEAVFKDIYRAVMGICFTDEYDGRPVGEESGHIRVTLTDGQIAETRFYDCDERRYIVTRPDGSRYLILKKNVYDALSETDNAQN